MCRIVSGRPVPSPTDADDGKVLEYDAVGGEFVLDQQLLGPVLRGERDANGPTGGVGERRL